MRYALRTLDDVPSDDAWLSAREREILAALEGEKRREEWRLGRWTAKALLGPDAEILAAPDGAPQVEGRPDAPRAERRALSISHRKGRALAVAGEGAVGCDLEPLAPHSDAFLRAVLSEGERARVEALDEEARLFVGTIAWTAKEAAYQALRGGREIRDAYAGFTGPHAASDAPLLTDGVWRPLLVDWPDGASIGGWWRAADGWVMSVASEPPIGSPPWTSS